MLVGTVVASQGVLFNVVALLEDGAVTAIRQKRELPNYGTFDEKRLFAPGPLPAPIDFRGVKIGVPICEDIWRSEEHTSELQSLMRISYAVCCLQKKKRIEYD